MAKFYTEEEIEFIKNFGPKFGPKICADKLGRGLEGVKSKFYKLGISISEKNVPKEEIESLNFNNSFVELNINFENHSNPKELAYWLGFFWADGYIRKDSELVIEIVEDDGIDLESIFMRLASFKIYKRSRKGRKPQITFYYRDKNIAQILKSLGKYSNSKESHEKILKYIPEKYKNYFIRGLIDGDGCFYFNSNHVQFSITNSINYDWIYLKDYLYNNYNLICSINNINSNHGNSSTLRASGKYNIIEFINKLYKIKDNIWLPRKFIKANFITQQFLKLKNNENIV